MEYYRKALDAAHQVDIERLNSDFSGLGDHYRDEFIKGAKLYVEGLKQSDGGKLLLGQVLLDRCGTWYSSNIDKIRKL